MHIKPRLQLIIIIFIAIGLLTGTIIQYKPEIPVFSGAHIPVIILDPGHGASDLCFKNPLQRAIKCLKYD